MITDTAAKKIYSAENICGLALEPCFKGSDFLNGTSRGPDEGTIDYPSRLHHWWRFWQIVNIYCIGFWLSSNSQ